MASLKDTIRQANDIKFEDVDIPEWDDIKVRVKSLPSADWELYQNKLHKMQMRTNSDTAEVLIHNNRAELVAKALYDPGTDERIFPDAKEGAKILGQKNAGIIAALFTLAHKLSDQDRSFGDKVKDAEGNSDDSQN